MILTATELRDVAQDHEVAAADLMREAREEPPKGAEARLDIAARARAHYIAAYACRQLARAKDRRAGR